MSKEDYIIYGPKNQNKVLFKSFGQYLYDCLRKRDPEDVLAINALSNERLKCGTLLKKTVKFSQVLRKLSIGKKDVVALLCENDVHSFTPIISLLYLGTPIHFANFGYSLDEMRHAFKTTQPKVVICAQQALDKILILKDELECIETVILIHGSSQESVKNIDSLIVESVCENFEIVDVDFEDTAWLCMSSGTSGLAKCVELTHKNLNYLVNCVLNKNGLNVSDKDITVSVIPVFHLFGLIINLSAVVTSMKTILIPALKPESFLKAISSFKATKLFAVPTLLHLFCTYQDINNFDISSITDVIVGGSYLSKDLYEAALKRFENATVRQMYGASETCGPCTMQAPSNNVYNIGTLLPNTACKVIDIQTGEIIGPGQSGEICISGDGVIKGYYGNPAETEKSIDKDHFYHTGDFGYYNNDGKLFIVGRTKELIKCKGFQVAPVELETLLMTHPCVQDCAIIGVRDDAAGEVPMACVVRKDNVTVTEDQIIKFVAERISPQKRLYGGVKFVDQIPKNNLQKVQKNKLVILYGNADH